MTTSTIQRRNVTYNGYSIHPIFIYSNGETDWEIYHGDQEKGELLPALTFEEVKEYIDRKE